MMTKDEKCPSTCRKQASTRRKQASRHGKEELGGEEEEGVAIGGSWGPGRRW